MRKRKIITDVKSIDFYKHYKEQTGSNLEYKIYINVIKDYFLKIINEIIYNNYFYKMPYGLGKIRIYKTKIKKREGSIKKYPINFGATNKLWKENPEAKKKKILIRHLNKHTNEYIMSISYSAIRATYKNKTIYSFQPVRQEFTRKLAKALQNENLNLEYYEK